ncbi:coiled-coil domain-containing 151 isoform X1 [Pelobates cultripes]|uniref:Coiled-coil domain-containing 151 isoform X1 n=1 Tax=Pelobates cultripes TaxID=61616 RepID=A0AAD1VXW3_PELCU|nr:coiled-coil domain-containing 151 isoform X1 [Pelobates cultripes]
MPATVSLDSVKPPIHEQIAELQKKIQLLDGDQKAFQEQSGWTIQKNGETIQWLRQENKKLHRKLADVLAGDEKVIKEAFQSRAVEKAAMRGKSGQAAIQVMDQKLCDKVKRLNALHHQTEKRRKHLEELQMLYKQNELVEQGKTGKEEEALEDEQNEATEQEEIPHQSLRVLENRLEKAQLKCQESEHIHNVYQKLKDHLQEESFTFQSQLDLLEAEILKQRQELKELQAMNKGAVMARDTARSELLRQEEELHRERRERDRILQEYKRQAEERRMHAERAERRAQRVILQGDDAPVETQLASNGQEEEKVIHTYQEAFQRIKDATGVTDTQEVVSRFIAQGETHRHLEQLKSENEKTLVRLKDEKERLQDAFQELKYSGEAKLSSGQQVLDELQMHLQMEEKKRDTSKEDLDRMSKILSSAKAGVEHLANKVQHIKVPRSHYPAPDLSPLSDEYVLDLLSITEEKLQKLLEELDGQDLGEVVKQMEEEEFQASIEGKLPAYNVRISLPAPAKQDIYDDEDSGDDEGDVVTRAALKRQSQQIVESKTKRRTRPKKKRGKQ